MELMEGENRVALTPSVIRKFRKLRFSVKIETGAGLKAGFRDDEYVQNGASIVNRQDVWAKSDIVLKIRKVDTYEDFNEMEQMGNLKMVVSYMYPA